MSINIAQYSIPRYANVSFGALGSVIDFGLREPGTITRRGMTVPTVEFPIADLHGYTVNLTARQTRIMDFVNLYTLVGSGPHEMLCKTANGLYLAFTDNTATFESPNGSSLLGANIRFTIGQDQRQLDYMGACRMAQTETNWMLNSSPTTIDGMTGSGLPYAQSYDRTSFRRRGISFVSINGVDYTIFSGSLFTAETKQAEQGGVDYRDRPYPTLLTTTFRTNLLTTDKTSLSNINTQEQLDGPFQIGTWCDETITWNAGSASMYVEQLGQTERGFMAQIVVTAELPMIPAAVALTPTTMTFSRAFS